MTPRERIARLAAILGVPDKVTVDKYRGTGMRGTRKTWVSVTLAAMSDGTDGPSEDAALEALAAQIEARAAKRPEYLRSAARTEDHQGGYDREMEAQYRDAAEKREARAKGLRASADAMDAALAAYLAERGTDPGPVPT